MSNPCQWRERKSNAWKRGNHKFVPSFGKYAKWNNPFWLFWIQLIPIKKGKHVKKTWADVSIQIVGSMQKLTSGVLLSNDTLWRSIITLCPWKAFICLDVIKGDILLWLCLRAFCMKCCITSGYMWVPVHTGFFFSRISETETNHIMDWERKGKETNEERRRMWTGNQWLSRVGGSISRLLRG